MAASAMHCEQQDGAVENKRRYAHRDSKNEEKIN
jgi:hypothetical protein